MSIAADDPSANLLNQLKQRSASDRWSQTAEGSAASALQAIESVPADRSRVRPFPGMEQAEVPSAPTVPVPAVAMPPVTPELGKDIKPTPAGERLLDHPENLVSGEHQWVMPRPDVALPTTLTEQPTGVNSARPVPVQLAAQTNLPAPPVLAPPAVTPPPLSGLPGSQQPPSPGLEGSTKQPFRDPGEPAVPLDNAGGPGNQPPLKPNAGLRRLVDISPFYDRHVDQDIRDYARDRAKEVGLVFDQGVAPERAFPAVVMNWNAADLYYRPLYFQDVALERYGHTYGEVVQPFVSLARFGTQFIFLPYQMAIRQPHSCEWALGYYRPGDCAPKLCYPIPLSAQGALAEGVVVTGLVFIIP